MFRKDEQSVTVCLRPVSSQDARPGGIESITLHTTRGEEISWRSMERDDCVLVRSSLSGTDSGDTIVSIHYHTEAELVSRELEVLYNDPLFESSMSVLAMVLSQR
jgi:hypothetical protein